MKLIVISDTHGMHRKVKNIPDGDVLIHCGDFSNVGEKEQIIDFIEWFASFPHKHKIFIAGNHDKSFDPKYWQSPSDKLWKEDTLDYVKIKGVTYLENSETVIDGVKFWGSPITPNFWEQYWAFNAARGETIKRYWDLIPKDTDVLITHGPPRHRKDWVINGGLSVGCEELDKRISEVNPIFNFFGHIHESYGIEEEVNTTFANASLLDEDYRLVNKPLEFKIYNDESALR